MKAHIVITTDSGEEFEGEATLSHTGEPHKKESSFKPTTFDTESKYTTGSVAWCLWDLKHQKGFFKDNAIRTTAEIIKKIKHSYGKTVNLANAQRDFLPLIKDRELDRDTLPGKQGRPTYIWFLPGTPQDIIESYKHSKVTK